MVVADQARIIDVLSAVKQGIEELTHREAVLEQLHRRLELYEQDDRARSFIEPLVRRFAPMVRRLNDQAAAFKSEASRLPASSLRRQILSAALSSVQAVIVELEVILGDFGVDLFSHRAASFDRSCQEIVGRVKTTTPAKVGMVQRSVAPGYRLRERVIVPERVIVYIKDEVQSNKERST